MSSIFIGNELDNTGKIANDKNVNEEKGTEYSRVNNVEESKASITSIKNKYGIVNAYITSINKKDDIFGKV